MKRLLLALCLTTSLAGAARAAENSSIEPAASPEPTITLEHKSSFDASNARNPFWPIGWTKPSVKGTESVEVAPLLSPASFTLTSVTTGGGDRFAILNGKVVQEGGQFGLVMGSKTVPVTVQAIQDGQVVLQYPGGEVVVPLRRR